MRTYEERRLCRACEGHGMIEPPYASFNADCTISPPLNVPMPMIACPCCDGKGYQEVKVKEE